MSNKIVFPFLVLLFSFFGCVAGKGIYYVPIETTSNSNGVNNYPYECGDFTISPIDFYADGLLLDYYLIPLGYSHPESKTETNLEIKISITSRIKPIFNLTMDDIAVKIQNSDRIFVPYKILISRNDYYPDIPLYSKSFHCLFDVDRHKIENFTLSFLHEINGCNLPPIDFFKETRKHFITPVNQ